MPATSPPTARRRRGAKVVLALLSLALATVLGEAVLRAAGGYRLFSLRLQPRLGRPDAVRQLELGADLVQPFVARWQRDRPDLDPAWLGTSPSPLPRPPELGKP